MCSDLHFQQLTQEKDMNTNFFNLGEYITVLYNKNNLYADVQKI